MNGTTDDGVDQILGTMDKAFRSRHTVGTNEVARILSPGDKFGLSDPLSNQLQMVVRMAQ